MSWPLLLGRTVFSIYIVLVSFYEGKEAMYV
jgi:hypothetical protein